MTHSIPSSCFHTEHLKMIMLQPNQIFCFIDICMIYPITLLICRTFFRSFVHGNTCIFYFHIWSSSILPSFYNQILQATGKGHAKLAQPCLFLFIHGMHQGSTWSYWCLNIPVHSFCFLIDNIRFLSEKSFFQVWMPHPHSAIHILYDPGFFFQYFIFIFQIAPAFWMCTLLLLKKTHLQTASTVHRKEYPLTVPCSFYTFPSLCGYFLLYLSVLLFPISPHLPSSLRNGT